MHFINPIWLFSIAAIIIPVVIHLWNIRPAKVLKVGSIALIEASSRKRSRSFKLLDVLLLLLRCLFIILLAFLLAMPYLKKHDVANKSKGWLLIPEENFKEVYQKFKPKTDSLLKSGYELHYFNAGFPMVDIKKAVIDSNKNNSATISYWNLLRQLDQLIPPKLSVYLITPGTSTHFIGGKPKVSLKLNWQTYTPADSTDTWIQSAWFAANKDVHVIQGTSKPSGISYTSQVVSSGTEGNSAYAINASKGQATIGFKNGTQQPISIDTAALKIEVFAGNNSPDAGYMKAALETVSQFTQRNIVIKSYSNSTEHSDWLFWLSDKPLDNGIAARFANVLIYEPGKATTINSWISSGNIYAVSQGQPVIPLYKMVNVKTYAGDVVWHDGFGHPVLSCGANGSSKLYHFYSRFNPGWSDLVWNDNFPEMMLQLIIKKEAFDSKHDKRVIDVRQVQPIISTEASILNGNHITDNDLTKYFWLAAALLFLSERWLAYKTTAGKKEQVV